MDTAYTVMITRAPAVLEISYFDMDCENQRKSGIFLPAPLEAVSPGRSTPRKRGCLLYWCKRIKEVVSLSTTTYFTGFSTLPNDFYVFKKVKRNKKALNPH